jgi:hypothetical protein
VSGRAPLTKRSEREREALSANVAAAPGPAGLRDIAAAVGNRAFTAYVATQQRVSAEPHPQLPAGTPAWAQDGEIVLGPPAALLSPDERADVVHHETIHVLQQRLAPAEETGAARDRAEQLADRPRGSLPSPAELQAPAPRLLAAPIKGKAATGFTRLFAGDGKIIGEVVDSGVAVRAELGYRELGIEAPVDPKSEFGTATMTDLQFLSCGNRAFPKLQAVATAMRSVAKQVAKVNGAIAAGSPWRVEQVFVVNEASRLHFADGKAFMVLSHTDFDSNGPETAAHEASHAVFESHSHPDPKQPDALAPDAFALRLADLFLRLAKTPSVPLPSEPFKKQRPPLKGGDGPQQPAGFVMVTDSLWSGGAATEGHPWEGPDEFFASAFGAFVRDPKLLAEMIAHYAPLDASIKSGGAELLSLLTAVKDPKAVKALQPPAAAQQKGATEAIRQRESQPSTIKERLGAILTPETLPPETVTCPAK